MNDNPDTPPATPAPRAHERLLEAAQRFPVATQLLLLALLLLGLFAAAGGNVSSFVSSVREEHPSGSERTTTLELPDSVSTVVLSVPEDIPLTADAAFVWDVKSQRVIFEKNADEVLPLASITKLMTALVAYELLEMGSDVTIPGNATKQDSPSGLSGGERFAASKLSALALIASSNDAAYSLGSAAGERLGDAEAVTQFVAAMNIRAEELGFEHLRFYNTTGLDISATEAGGYGTAREVTYLLEYLIQHYPELVYTTTQAETTVQNTAGETHDAENTNLLVGQIPNILASKTGYTDLAGGNLTVAFDMGYDRPIIVTVLSSSRNDRFSDVARLVDAVTDAQ